MGLVWDKQPSSKILKSQMLPYTGGGTLVSTPFTSETYQLRVFSQVSGQITIGTTTTTVTSAPTTGALGGIGGSDPAQVFIPASTVGGEYFTVSPGQTFQFASTSTSSGTVNITEMS
jgi:hypothetical protein